MRTLLSVFVGVTTTESEGEENGDSATNGGICPSSSTGDGEMRPATNARGEWGKDMDGGVWPLKVSELVREGGGVECPALGL